MPNITATFGFTPPQPPTIGSDEIARLLEMAPRTFQRRRHQLISAGMPRPVPGFAQRWSRAAIMAWIGSNNALAGATHKVAADAPLDPIAAHRQHLEDRMGGGR